MFSKVVRGRRLPAFDFADSPACRAQRPTLHGRSTAPRLVAAHEPLCRYRTPRRARVGRYRHAHPWPGAARRLRRSLLRRTER
eukprot:737184-Rhodomonas_salina.2